MANQKRYVAALIVLTAMAGGCDQQIEAQRLMDQAVAHQKAYDEAYSRSQMGQARQEMAAAMEIYAQGANRFPDNSGFNSGLGIFQNICGQYVSAAASYRRELDILGQFKEESASLKEDKFFTSAALGEAYEHGLDFTSACKYYTQALEYKKDDAETKASIQRCTLHEKQFRDLPGWVAAPGVADGTKVAVVYDLGPRTYSGYRQINYRLEKKDGKVHVSLTVSAAYMGQESNRPLVERRLARIMELVDECYARSGLVLHMELKFVADPDKTPELCNVLVWDNYQPADQRDADSENWPVLRVHGLDLAPELAAAAIGHEIGHLLGLAHPTYYPDRPYNDLMTGAHPWAGIESKRLFPRAVQVIVGPLLAAPPCRDALKAADDLVNAGKRDEAIKLLAAARKVCPDDAALCRALANALFDADSYAEAAEAYSGLIALTPGDYEAYFFRGISYCRSRHYEKAVKDFSAIVERPSGGLHVSAYFERAIAYEKFNQPAKAAADRRKSDAAITNPEPEAPPAAASQAASRPSNKQ
ncbi:MAG: tetratricopeptide repeat protein [Planctomycetaceae bacterium]|nr:tetratricopeptide repeat protein [Planctomycetaceae bacterium]